MKKNVFILFILIIFSHNPIFAIEVYVDPVKGKDTNPGTMNAPLATLEKAVALANEAGNSTSQVVKLFPALYVLKDIIVIDAKIAKQNKERYIIEAVVMPDDPDWSQDKMPVILSTSANNSNTQFPHSTGFLVAGNNVTIRGLKFVGNSNPEVLYYYPISKEDPTLGGMEISQCYFIAEKNTSPIQGAIWAHGPDTKIDHCIFFNCKNAVLLFNSVEGFSVTHSIIYGAYESAVWMGPIDSDFTFQNNIIAKCNYVWVRPEDTQPHYSFSNCLIVDNEHYMGFYTKDGLIETSENINFTETNLLKKGEVKLIERNSQTLPINNLHLAGSDKSWSLEAGIFKRSKENIE